jgi:hypothetical protein
MDAHYFPVCCCGGKHDEACGNPSLSTWKRIRGNFSSGIIRFKSDTVRCTRQWPTRGSQILATTASGEYVPYYLVKNRIVWCRRGAGLVTPPCSIIPRGVNLSCAYFLGLWIWRCSLNLLFYLPAQVLAILTPLLFLVVHLFTFVCS